MKTKIAAILLSSFIVIPATQMLVQADTTKKQAKEKTESIQTKQREEQRAFDRYQADFKKYGANDAKTKKAWAHYQRELKEHGDQAQGKQPLG